MHNYALGVFFHTWCQKERHINNRYTQRKFPPLAHYVLINKIKPDLNLEYQQDKLSFLIILSTGPVQLYIEDIIIKEDRLTPSTTFPLLADFSRATLED